MPHCGNIYDYAVRNGILSIRSKASTGQLSVNDVHDSSMLTITTGRLLWL
jgi:hypothetical protein